MVLGLCVWDQKPKYDNWRKTKAGVYSFPVAYDPAGEDQAKSMTLAYHVDSIPAQIVIDKNGIVAALPNAEGENTHSLEDALAKLGVTGDKAADARPAAPPVKVASGSL